MVDPGFDIPELNPAQEVMSMNLDKIICTDPEDVNISTLVNSNLTDEIDKNNTFFCHECSTEVTNFDSLEKHMEKHFMEFSISTDSNTKVEDSAKDSQPNDKQCIVKKQVAEEKEPVSKDSNIFCPICHVKSCRIAELSYHVINKHFKQEMSDLYVDQEKDSQTCKQCQRSFSSRKLLLRHIFHFHQALKQIAPKEVLQKLESMKEGYKRKRSNSKESSRSSTTQYRCTLCQTSTLSYENFVLHLGKEHYMTKLNKFHKQMSSQCEECIKLISDDNKLIGHLIIEHGVLNEELKS